MRSMTFLVAAAAVLALAGCSASTQTPEPTATEANKNIAACETFEDQSFAMATAITSISKGGDTTADYATLDNLAAELDTTALSAEGDVKMRMATLVENLPDPLVTLWISGDTDYFEDVAAVSRACAADAAPISPATWG